MPKAAVIGDSASVLGFSALGLTSAVAETPGEAAKQLHDLAKDGHAIIYITEQLAAKIEKDISRYSENPDCAVILIPSVDGSLGIGMQQMHKAVERAVGADILRDKD